MKKKVDIENSWYKLLETEFSKEYFVNLTEKVKADYKYNTVFPQASNIFRAFNLTPVDCVKVVILGQDPYHGKGQAHGLAFSVPKNTKIPPSLTNIYKELKSDIDKVVEDGDLSLWAKQGVLLLNTSLTVISGRAGSHSRIGWQYFTDAVISKLSKNTKGIVFMLWGRHAQSKEALVNINDHCVLKCAHPSPLSAYNGFFGSRHFSKANKFLEKINKKPIIW